MSEPTQPSRFPSWLGAAIVTLLTLQLGLVWVQGGLLHRQHRDLQDLREDVQSLTEALDQSLLQDSGADTELAPTHARARAHRLPRRLERVRMLQESQQPSDEEKARKELEESKNSAQKAVKDAREVQSKLSIEENYRKAEEKKQVEAAQNTWTKWVWAALGLLALAMVGRAWLRRRG